MATPRKQHASRTTSPKTISRQAAPHGNGAAPLPPELLQRLYYYMLKSRLVEERARLLFRQGKIRGNYCAAVGREAIEVGATIDLQPADTLASSHPSLITNIMKGTPLQDVYAQLYAGNSSPDQVRSSSNVFTHASAIVAQLDIGIGIALANKLQKKPNIVVTLWDEASSSLGFWHEALKFAGVHKLPTVHVLENNSWPEPLPPHLETLGVENLCLTEQTYGFPVITVDGNDVVAVYRVCHEARERARQGFGPTLVDCKKVEHGKRQDPVFLMERYLQKQRLWSDDWKQEQANSINAEIDEAIALAESSLDA